MAKKLISKKKVSEKERRAKTAKRVAKYRAKKVGQGYKSTVVLFKPSVLKMLNKQAKSADMTQSELIAELIRRNN